VRIVIPWNIVCRRSKWTIVCTTILLVVRARAWERHMSLYMRSRSSRTRSVPTIIRTIGGVTMTGHAHRRVILLLGRNGIRMKWCLLWPFGFSPSNNHVAYAKGVSMFGSVVLDHSFEPVKPGISFTTTAVAEKEFFPELFC
jgi:hypothetical protein